MVSIPTVSSSKNPNDVLEMKAALKAKNNEAKRAVPLLQNVLPKRYMARQDAAPNITGNIMVKSYNEIVNPKSDINI